MSDNSQQMLRDAIRANKEDRERAEILVALRKRPEWEVFQELLNTRIQGVSDNLLQPCGGLDGTYMTEYYKGLMAGLILSRDLPALYEAALEDIKQQSPAVPAPDDDYTLDDGDDDDDDAH